jgi:hypothetical protein
MFRFSVVPEFEFLGVLCGLSFANFAVKGCCSRRKSKDSNRKRREGKAAKSAKKFSRYRFFAAPEVLRRPKSQAAPFDDSFR